MKYLDKYIFYNQVSYKTVNTPLSIQQVKSTPWLCLASDPPTLPLPFLLPACLASAFPTLPPPCLCLSWLASALTHLAFSLPPPCLLFAYIVSDLPTLPLPLPCLTFRCLHIACLGLAFLVFASAFTPSCLWIPWFTLAPSALTASP